MGVLKRPWRRRKRFGEPETVMHLSRRNYKVAAYVGRNQIAMNKFAATLDTGAGSSFIKRSVIPGTLENEIKPLTEDIRVKDANNRSLNILGTISLQVQVGSRAEAISFYVVERLATSVILGCNFCDKHVEAIRPRLRLVEMDDGTTIPIIRRPEAARLNDAPIPEEQRWVPNKRRSSRGINVVETTVLQPGEQTWVKVASPAHGLILVEPVQKLYRNHLCLAGAGIAQVEPEKDFKILVANFGKHPVTLRPTQRIATAEPHPTTLLESKVTHGEVLGLVEDTPAPTGKYRKRTTNAKDAKVINQHLADKGKSYERRR